jgi:micrococcal nuclease
MKKAIVFLLCIAFCSAQTHRRDSGTVIAVYDGDTIMMRFDDGREQRVRLIGIDTPEIADTPSEEQLTALLAKRFTFHHLFRKSIELTYDREKEDKYGRLLAYVWTGDSLFNEFILKEGVARVYLKFPFVMRERFIRAQEEAEEKRRGFWQEIPYPLIADQHAGEHIGKFRRVGFVCARLRRSGNFLFLVSGTGNFAVLIPAEYLPFFSDIQKFVGKSLEAVGFLEEYRGQSQIMVFFPSQILIR